MKEGYRFLGEYIRQVDIRNKEGKKENLLGVSVQKQFIQSGETGGKEAFLQLKGLCQRRSAHDRAGERSSADAEGEQYYAVSFREILHAGISG